MFVVFDLDGTLALNEHRQHFVERPVGEKDWDAFFDACDGDTPNYPIIHTMRALALSRHRVEVWSGRTSRVMEKTRAWLNANGCAFVSVRCRAEGDHTPDHILKKQWLDASPQKPDLVFDDRASVVAMWRENGIVCAQVAPGDF